MKNKNIIIVLAICLSITASISASFGIFSNGGNGNYKIESVRGQKVTIYGYGLYEHMSADVAIQGIAQDYITLFIGVPLLLLSLIFALKNSVKGKFILTGTLGYFFLTYLFYTAMAMYNGMFLMYVVSLSLSFFSLVMMLISLNGTIFISEKRLRYGGVFLIINASLIALLWLSIIVPPLLNGTIIPAQVQHYTTLIVQGFDLGLFLPAAFVSGLLAIRKNRLGYIFTTTYMVFLSLLMTALVSKILFMAGAGANVIPVIFIMPVILLIALVFSFLLVNNISGEKA